MLPLDSSHLRAVPLYERSTLQPVLPLWVSKSSGTLLCTGREQKHRPSNLSNHSTCIHEARIHSVKTRLNTDLSCIVSFYRQSLIKMTLCSQLVQWTRICFFQVKWQFCHLKFYVLNFSYNGNPERRKEMNYSFLLYLGGETEIVHFLHIKITFYIISVPQAVSFSGWQSSVFWEWCWIFQKTSVAINKSGI